MDKQTLIEWEAWKNVVKTLRSIGVEINDQDQLNADIREWGLEYARLAKRFPKLLEESDR